MDKQLSPKVSVVIPTANRSSLVKRAISSVLNQDYTHIECIVVDDASKDDTSSVVQGISDSRLVYLRHDSSKHASASRNTGINAATGDYIAFLDDDDEWLQEKIIRQVSLLNSSDDNVGMVYCWMEYCDDEKTISYRKPELEGYIFKETLSKQPIGNSSTLLVKRKVIDDVGGFDESLPRGNDGDFIRRVCQKYSVAYVDEVLVRIYVEHGHKRITSNDLSGVRNGLNAQYTKLQKFVGVQDVYPKEFAEIYRIIFIDHLKVSEYKNAIKAWLIACRFHPFSLSNISVFFKAAKQLLK